MKWFWISFFAFLAVLVGSAALARPDTVSNTLTFVGNFLTVAAWTILVLIVAGALFVAWLKWRRDALKSLRTQDGHYPLQRIKLQNGSVAYFDPNLMVGALAIVSRADGSLAEPEPAAGWHVQATIRAFVERTRTAQAMFPGDDSRSSKYGSMNRGGSVADASRLLADPKPVPQLPAPVDVAPTPISATVREWTPIDAMTQNTRTKLVLGQADGKLVKWDMLERPHLRFHGMTQNGKTTAIQTVAAAAIRTQAHVIVLDRRKFKDWGAFRACAELVDTRDPQAFADAVTKLRDIYQARDVTLGQHGAANISELDNPPQRIVVVVAEFGALCSAAADEGVLKDVIGPLQLIMREAGSAGVHLLIEDQAVKDWPRGIVANAEPVSGYLPLNYGSTGGYHDAHKLQPYTFHYAGTVFKTFDMRAALPGVLAGQVAGEKVVSGKKEGVSQVVSSGDSAGVSSVSTRETPLPVDTGNATNTPDPGKWYDFILNYMATEKGRGLWLAPAEGVRDLARAMSRHDTGDEAAEAAYVSIASKTAKQIRSDIHLPNGERLGTDVSVRA